MFERTLVIVISIFCNLGADSSIAEEKELNVGEYFDDSNFHFF